MSILNAMRDRIVGTRQAHDIPPLDGPFRQNDALERAWIVAEKLAAPDDLVIDAGGFIHISSGGQILRQHWVSGRLPDVFATLPAAVGGLCLLQGGRLAACLEGEGVAILDASGEIVDRLRTAGGASVRCATAVASGPDGALYVAEGSVENLASGWIRDLMEKRTTGRLIRWKPGHEAEVLLYGLAWPSGVCLTQGGGDILVAEAWTHTLSRYPLAAVRPQARRECIANMPGYPGRITRSPDGGYWLAMFAPRNPLTEFVLKEDQFRDEMIRTVDPAAWISPSLASSAIDVTPWKSPDYTSNKRFLETEQAGRLRSFGVMKPWAPARSYGLVVKLDHEFDPVTSLHSRVNDVRHGTTAALEYEGAVYVVSKGYGTILKAATLPALERATEAIKKKKSAREKIKTYLSGQTAVDTGHETILKVAGATKLYGSVAAITDMNFDLRRGEIHALLGENGAGKSTLCKSLAGAIRLTSGTIEINGKEQSFRSSADAMKAGIAMVYQETSLVASMTVAQNMELGHEKAFNPLRRLNTNAQQFLASLNFGAIDATSYVGALGQAQRQMVEIARAIYFKAKVIIFDEPTASLTPGETAAFFEILEMLKKHGVAIIYISHNLEESLELADRITVMRDGLHVITDRVDAFSRDSIVKHMIGRDTPAHHTQIGRREQRATRKKKRVLSIENVFMTPMVKGMTFSLYEGEITGIAGLVGSGRTEIAKVIAGVLKRDLVRGGAIYLDGEPVRFRQPSQAIDRGIVYVTEDRKVNGFFETMGIDENIYMGRLGSPKGRAALVSETAKQRIGKDWIERLNIRAIDMKLKVNRLSGGNQQKVVVAKSLVQEPRIIIIDEPTRGVDVGAIQEMHNYIRSLVKPDVVVVVICSYLPEILALADRVLVARQGRIVAEFSGADATEDKIMFAALH